MAAPFPPQGNQTPHTERPLKVYAERYLEGLPLPVGVVLNVGDPAFFDEDRARVLLPDGNVEIQIGQWVISNRYTGKPMEVISAEEFTERFGPSTE